jgi:mannitol-1-phosphate/altronate dehydrogenase
VVHAEYKKSIIDRLVNPYMRDELTRLARNGSQKVPGRFLQPLSEALATGTPDDHFAFGVAAWLRYVKGYDANGKEFDIADAESIRMGLQDVARKSNGNAYPLFSFLEVFGRDLPSNAAFTEKVSGYLRSIVDNGMVAALEQFEQDREKKAEIGPNAPDAKPTAGECHFRP